MILSSVLLLAIAYLIHQKMIDWDFHYSVDRSSLDELSYREVLVQDIMASIFVYLLIIGLFVFAIRTNTFLYEYWVHVFHVSEQFFRGL
ncbi:hypothetical protein QF013_002659 [Pseudomonas laurylsulfatiphila]